MDLLQVLLLKDQKFNSLEVRGAYSSHLVLQIELIQVDLAMNQLTSSYAPLRMLSLSLLTACDSSSMLHSFSSMSALYLNQ